MMLFLFCLLSAASAHSSMMLQQAPKADASAEDHTIEKALAEMKTYAGDEHSDAVDAQEARAKAALGEATGTGFNTSNISSYAEKNRNASITGGVTNLGNNFSTATVMDEVTADDLQNVKNALAGAYNASKTTGVGADLAKKYTESQQDQDGLTTKAPYGNDITGKTDPTATETFNMGTDKTNYTKHTTKKGDGDRANMVQNLATESQADVNTTRTFTNNNQTDTRLNKTGRYETPRLFTNRSGHAKVSWRGTDKMAMWEMGNAVQFIIDGATKVDQQTGSVGRVGESTDTPSYNADQVNFRSAVGPPVSAGDR